LSINSFNKGDFDKLSLFLSGGAKYLVKKDYGIERPVLFEDAIINTERTWGGDVRFDGLKLLSVAGKSKGDLSYGLNRYGDGSGGSTEVMPFSCFESACLYVKELAEVRIKEGKLTFQDYEICKGLGIEFTKKQNKTLKAKFLSNSSAKLKRIRKNIEDHQDKEKENQDKILKAFAHD
jgi:hypothetical protein